MIWQFISLRYCSRNGAISPSCVICASITIALHPGMPDPYEQLNVESDSVSVVQVTAGVELAEPTDVPRHWPHSAARDGIPPLGRLRSDRALPEEGVR